MAIQQNTCPGRQRSKTGAAVSIGLNPATAYFAQGTTPCNGPLHEIFGVTRVWVAVRVTFRFYVHTQVPMLRMCANALVHGGGVA